MKVGWFFNIEWFLLEKSVLLRIDACQLHCASCVLNSRHHMMTSFKGQKLVHSGTFKSGQEGIITGTVDIFVVSQPKLLKF